MRNVALVSDARGYSKLNSDPASSVITVTGSIANGYPPAADSQQDVDEEMRSVRATLLVVLLPNHWNEHLPITIVSIVVSFCLVVRIRSSSAIL